MIEITLNDLYKGKSILIKNKQYLSTKQYTEPFVDRLSTFGASFKIQAIQPKQMTKEGEHVDMAYTKVLIDAVLPIKYDSGKSFRQCISMAYSLDVKKPICKFYRTVVDTSTNWMYNFDQNAILIQEIEDSSAIDYSVIKSLMELTDNHDVMYNQLLGIELDRNKISNDLGAWIHYFLTEEYSNSIGRVKIKSDLPISVYKKMFIDSNNNLYISQGHPISLIDVYETFSDIIVYDE